LIGRRRVSVRRGGGLTALIRLRLVRTAIVRARGRGRSALGRILRAQVARSIHVVLLFLAGGLALALVGRRGLVLIRRLRLVAGLCALAAFFAARFLACGRLLALGRLGLILHLPLRLILGAVLGLLVGRRRGRLVRRWLVLRDGRSRDCEPERA